METPICYDSDLSQLSVIMELHVLRWHRLVVPGGLDQLSSFAADSKHLSCILQGKMIPFRSGKCHKQADTSHKDRLPTKVMRSESDVFSKVFSSFSQIGASAVSAAIRAGKPVF